jgi:hypothetical protein
MDQDEYREVKTQLQQAVATHESMRPDIQRTETVYKRTDNQQTIYKRNDNQYRDLDDNDLGDNPAINVDGPAPAPEPEDLAVALDKFSEAVTKRLAEDHQRLAALERENVQLRGNRERIAQLEGKVEILLGLLQTRINPTH